MSTVITITNQKGGTGKTTTAAALLAGLSAKGHSVLGIDFDPQMNLTYAVEGKEGYSIYGILIKETRHPTPSSTRRNTAISSSARSTCHPSVRSSRARAVNSGSGNSWPRTG